MILIVSWSHRWNAVNNLVYFRKDLIVINSYLLHIHIAPHYIHIQNVEMWWIHIASTFYVRRSTLHQRLKRYGHSSTFGH